MGPDTASVSKTESPEKSPGQVVVEVTTDTDSNESSSASEPEDSNHPEKSYTCSICSKAFDRPSKLERHKPVHTRKPKTLHQCEHCEKSFTQEEKLIRHQSCHSRTNKHPCPDCGKVFNRPSKFSWSHSLSRHRRTHTHIQMSMETTKDTSSFEGPSENPSS
ncbi:Zinc finger protein 629 [Dissostichus eleginoides]|uniref:Zinc finger protein 629 n=1 Tax=Dissostichus eleginoides TaxID=100907 RepID=A0AAD9BQE1_DISEL|nr:Zinc finger protein 629 [Dissostichus eleginoides]